MSGRPARAPVTRGQRSRQVRRAWMAMQAVATALAVALEDADRPRWRARLLAGGWSAGMVEQIEQLAASHAHALAAPGVALARPPGGPAPGAAPWWRRAWARMRLWLLVRP